MKTYYFIRVSAPDCPDFVQAVYDNKEEAMAIVKNTPYVNLYSAEWSGNGYFPRDMKYVKRENDL